MKLDEPRVQGFLQAHNEGRAIAQEIIVALDDLHALLYKRGGFKHPNDVEWERAARAADRLAQVLRDAPADFEHGRTRPRPGRPTPTPLATEDCAGPFSSLVVPRS